MTRSNLFVLLLLPLSFVVPAKDARAPEVVITLLTGEECKGEILSVHDHVLVLSSRCGLSEDLLERNKDALLIVELDSIGEVTVCGKSYVLMGMGVAGGVGALTGGLMGLLRDVSPPREEQRRAFDYNVDAADCGSQVGKHLGNGALGCAIGTAAGLVLGGLAGAALSQKDSIVSGSRAQDTTSLKALARYRGDEPEFLQRMHSQYP